MGGRAGGRAGGREGAREGGRRGPSPPLRPTKGAVYAFKNSGPPLRRRGAYGMECGWLLDSPPLFGPLQGIAVHRSLHRQML